MKQSVINSPIGPLYLTASEKGLSGIYWKSQKYPIVKAPKASDPIEKHLIKASQQLNEYFNGERKDFDIPLDLQGTEFQKRVWKALTQIKYGKTLSYKALAEKVGSPNAYRAVGSANGKNPVCIIVPCHRVIAANGELGGYSGRGGLKTKKVLLSLEATN